jgi:hypothetical protein
MAGLLTDRMVIVVSHCARPSRNKFKQLVRLLRCNVWRKRRDIAGGAGIVSDRRVLLIIGGGIAAYKCLELVRLLRGQGVAVRQVLTKATSS